ncbi:hypothetical protein ACFO0S_10750 [Chryseomicrobium palamuruense]|uniref:PAS domain-containing protein n=1 Tax=Chryseomicrobium palamuruense TaxID=682973 RepID=A0ABV8UX25_9BACL
MKINTCLTNLYQFFSEKDLHLLLERMPEPLCLLNSNEFGQPLQFIYANTKAEELLNMSADELCTFTWSEFFGAQLESTMEEIEETYKDRLYTHKQSPLFNHLQGRALKVSLKDFFTTDGKPFFCPNYCRCHGSLSDEGKVTCHIIGV